MTDRPFPPIIGRIVRWHNFFTAAKQEQDRIEAQKRTNAQQELDRIIIAEGIEKWVHEGAKSPIKGSSK